MAIRFRRVPSVSRGSSAAREGGDHFDQWWAAAAILAVTIMGMLSLGSGSQSLGITPRPADGTERILASLQTAESSLSEITANFQTLCKEPVLAALELEPDCATGAMTLEDGLFLGDGGSQLTNAGKEDVSAAMTTYLQRLREMPAIWESLEAIEIRGHSDPRAFRNAYQTNLVGSQQRALGVLLYLVSPKSLSDKDREDLERLATVSGASFSRPPEACPEATRECYPLWRRVEIRPVLSEPMRREEWSQTLESVRVAARRVQDERQSENP